MKSLDSFISCEFDTVLLFSCLCVAFSIFEIIASGFEFFLTAQAEENSQREQTIYSSIILCMKEYKLNCVSHT